MGNQTSASDEWMELYNSGSSAEDLSGWILISEDGGMTINLQGNISAGAYYLIERTDDTTVPEIMADLISPFGNGLSNSGEILILKNSSGQEIDRVDASAGWPAGDNATKETMQKSASGWITAAPTPKSINSGAGQAVESNGDADQSQTPAPAESGSVMPPPAPQIIADAGGKRIAISGAMIKFEAKVTGLKGEPLKADDYLWNMGDGSIKRGRFVYHVYNFIGDYNIDLSVSVGGISVSDRATVTVVPNGVVISEIKPGNGGWAEIFNDSKFIVDLSHWGISNGSKVFYFPENTAILSQSRVVITETASSIVFPDSGSAALLYPDGKTARQFVYSGHIQDDESFHYVGDEIKIGIESPGENKFVARVSSGSKSRVLNISNSSVSEVAPPSKSDEDKISIPANKQTAAVGDSSFAGSSFFWFVIALAVGILSAGGYLFIVRRGSP